ncbi:MAG: hypothetical protein J5661_07630 [Bacteroidaceae bacterium]|nr:hypothetical protein [Bacteroidaceae bacterium]
MIKDFWNDIYSIENESKAYASYCLALAKSENASEIEEEAHRGIIAFETCCVCGTTVFREWVDSTITMNSASYLEKKVRQVLFDAKDTYDAFVNNLSESREQNKQTLDYGFLAFLAMVSLRIGHKLNSETIKVAERKDNWYCATDSLFTREFTITAYEELDRMRLYDDLIKNNVFSCYEKSALYLFLSERFGNEFENLWRDMAKDMLGNKTVAELKKQAWKKYYNKGINPILIGCSFAYALIFMATMNKNK